uniref:Uncharacterized protein n=1 Tax=Glossina austeni TaxID=7395 RepID=A0A1A9V880_GLOAU
MTIITMPFINLRLIFITTTLIVTSVTVLGQDVVEEPFDLEIESNAIDDHNAKVSENRLAAQLFAVLEHYKQEDPVGIPGFPISDPFEMPNVKQSLGMANLNMMKIKAYGLSSFRLTSVKVDLKDMKAEGVIELDEMYTNGSYTLNSLFSNANGPFNVILKKVMAKGTAVLGVQRSGHLAIERLKIDITFADMGMDFQNLGFLGNIFQGIVNSAPTLVFDSMKPFMLQAADKQFREMVNKNITEIMGERLLPNSITPLDMVIAEARKKVRENGCDPFRLPDYNRTVGVFSMQLSNSWINGISSFYRVGDVIVLMANKTVNLILQVGTQQISGAGQWEVGCGLVTRIGHVHFTLQHIRATVSVSQPLDTRKRPQINDLQIDLGNIQARCDGAGTLDYILEFAVNVLPNMLRYQIMDALENPIKKRIQEQFNSIDVEQAIKNNLEKFQQNVELTCDFKFI